MILFFSQFPLSNRFAQLLAALNAPTYLLSGSTGLVGRYLLAGLLRGGQHVAVLVRSSSRGNACQRIEESLSSFEHECLLPRPRVIEANLLAPRLGIGEEELAWLRMRPISVIHCAASIRFVETPDSGEPYRTNVDGTRELLDVCRTLNVVDFHHVSTAYVGSRAGTNVITEKWINDDGLAGNDYELSKIRAERVIRDCDWLPSRTIHRPSIVVGDSLSGYTSTFHGFYAPLQIGAQYARAFGFSRAAGDRFRQQLGISETDSKNLVPVDWVAKSIVSVATSAAESPTLGSARILHWTNPLPVPCTEMQSAIVDAIERRFGGKRELPQQESHLALPGADEFRQQLGVYESYFGNDPTFDTRHSQKYTSGTAGCPRVDYTLLSKLADFALENNFGWPKPPLPVRPHQSLLKALVAFPSAPAASNSSCTVSLQLLGPGARECLNFQHGSQGWFQTAAHAEKAANHMDWRISVGKLHDCIIGRIDPIQAIDEGYWGIQGSPPDGLLEIVNAWVNDVSSQYST